ncbi:branched-chain amino acid transport system substrate-binding protein [Oxalobacteraceae bacterium GrIS 1.11]
MQMKIKRLLRLIVAVVWTFQAIAASAVEPIRIGMVNETSGANAEVGIYQANGVALALEEINQAGGVLGRPLKVDIEDNQSTNPGSVLALSKLVGGGNVVAIITSIRSTQTLAIMPKIIRAGIPAMVGGTDYTLTHANNPWIFRARPHDGYSAKVIADFGVNILKKKKWAIVHSTEAFGIGGKDRLIDALKKFDITPLLIQGVNNNTQDYTPAALAIKKSDIDIVATYLASPSDVGNFALLLRQSGVDRVLIGSPSVTGVAAVRIGAAALYDSYSINDYVAESNPQAQAYATKYKAKWGIEPDLYSSWAYDAVHILALAMKNANSTNPEALRKAILAIRGYKGVEGTYNYDQNGDGVHGYNVVKNEHGKIVFIKHISFQPE